MTDKEQILATFPDALIEEPSPFAFIVWTSKGGTMIGAGITEAAAWADAVTMLDYVMERA